MAGEWELWLPIVLMVVLFIFLLLDIYARRAAPPWLLPSVGGAHCSRTAKSCCGGAALRQACQWQCPSQPATCAAVG